MKTNRRDWVAPTVAVMLAALPRTAQAGYGPQEPPEPPEPQAKREYNFKLDTWLGVHRGRRR